jgi:hypothetical protein
MEADAPCWEFLFPSLPSLSKLLERIEEQAQESVISHASRLQQVLSPNEDEGGAADPVPLSMECWKETETTSEDKEMQEPKKINNFAFMEWRPWPAICVLCILNLIYIPPLPSLWQAVGPGHPLSHMWRWTIQLLPIVFPLVMLSIYLIIVGVDIIVLSRGSIPVLEFLFGSLLLSGVVAARVMLSWQLLDEKPHQILPELLDCRKKLVAQKRINVFLALLLFLSVCVFSILMVTFPFSYAAEFERRGSDAWGLIVVVVHYIFNFWTAISTTMVAILLLIYLFALTENIRLFGYQLVDSQDFTPNGVIKQLHRFRYISAEFHQTAGFYQTSHSVLMLVLVTWTVYNFYVVIAASSLNVTLIFATINFVMGIGLIVLSFSPAMYVTEGFSTLLQIANTLQSLDYSLLASLVQMMQVTDSTYDMLGFQIDQAFVARIVWAAYFIFGYLVQQVVRTISATPSS